MRNKYVLSALTCLVSILLMYTATNTLKQSYSTKVIKAGFVYRIYDHMRDTYLWIFKTN